MGSSSSPPTRARTESVAYSAFRLISRNDARDHDVAGYPPEEDFHQNRDTSMALLAEELVEEWLNRQGYFTIRGVKIGVDEIDILATRFTADRIEYRHLEVQASMRPVSYISRVPKEAQKKGRAANSAKRTKEELEVGVKEWVEKKYKKPRKVQLIKSLAPATWSSELVINNVKSQEEIALIERYGIRIIRLPEILDALKRQRFVVQSAAGADFVDLVNMGAGEIGKQSK